MKKFSMKKKIIAGAAAAALVAGVGGAAFAYFSTSGSGSGSATVGTSSALTIHQATLVYSNGVNLLPGTSATATFTVDNPSTGNQNLGTISVASITSDKAGCDSTAQPTWFTSNTDVVNANYAPGNTQPVAGDLTVNFVNATDTTPGDGLGNQDVCKGATLTINYTSN